MCAGLQIWAVWHLNLNFLRSRECRNLKQWRPNTCSNFFCILFQSWLNTVLQECWCGQESMLSDLMIWTHSWVKMADSITVEYDQSVQCEVGAGRGNSLGPWRWCPGRCSQQGSAQNRSSWSKWREIEENVLAQSECAVAQRQILCVTGMYWQAQLGQRSLCQKLEQFLISQKQ